jgi:hypothetical protein
MAVKPKQDEDFNSYEKRRKAADKKKGPKRKVDHVHHRKLDDGKVLTTTHFASPPGQPMPDPHEQVHDTPEQAGSYTSQAFGGAALPSPDGEEQAEGE